MRPRVLGMMGVFAVLASTGAAFEPQHVPVSVEGVVPPPASPRIPRTARELAAGAKRRARAKANRKRRGW